MFSGFVFLLSLYVVKLTDGQAFHNNDNIEIKNLFFQQNIFYKPTFHNASAPKPTEVPTQSTSSTRNPTKPPFAGRPSPSPPSAPKKKEPKKLTRAQLEVAKIVTNLKLTIDGKRVKPNTRSFKTAVADYLFDETVEERAKVWEAMAKLNGMIAKANNEKVPRNWDIDEVSGRIDDEIYGIDDLKLMIPFYAINQGYLTLKNKVKEKTPRGIFKKRAKKWEMPIQYRIRSTKKRPVDSKVVKEAIAAWEKDSCIRFRQRTGGIKGPNIVFRYHKKHCQSCVGRKPITQSIWLTTNCQKKKVKVMHEIGHALGFKHEHQRPGRGDYINVIKKNIKGGRKIKRNFLELSSKWTDTYGYPYDYSSIMHYKTTDFSKDTKKLNTIETRDRDYMKTIGQRLEMSFYDKKAANRRYCNGVCRGGLESSKCKNGSYRNPKKCSHCICPDGWRGQYCDKVARSKPNSSSCGDTTLSAKTRIQTFTSPKFNNGGYTSKNECSWKIRAPLGNRVRFKLVKKDFKLHCKTPCRDFVEVRYRSMSRPGPRFCCTKRPSKWFVSRTNVMLINFRTFSGSGSNGFKAQYRYKSLPISGGNSNKKQ